jgi:O-antigen ligase
MLDTFSGGSASLRLEIWRSAFGMVRDAPVWGYGPDGFLYSYAPRYVSPSAWAERFTAHAHNLLLDAWIRLGIIGAAIVAVALVACLLVVYQRVLRRDGGHGLDTVALVALVTVFVHGMVDNAYFGHDLAMSTWLLMWLAVDRRGNAVEGDSVSGAHPGDRRRRLYRLAPV